MARYDPREFGRRIDAASSLAELIALRGRIRKETHARCTEHQGNDSICRRHARKNWTQHIIDRAAALVGETKTAVEKNLHSLKVPAPPRSAASQTVSPALPVILLAAAALYAIYG